MGRHVTAPIRPARARGNARPVSDFTLTRRVQFYETDAAGIVHFSVFFRYMEEAEHAMWRAAGLSIATPDAPIGFPRVATSFEFLRPLRFEDEFDVRLRVTDKTPKTLSYSATIEKDGMTLARGTLTVACVRTRPGEAMRGSDIPADIADRFTVAAPERGQVDG